MLEENLFELMRARGKPHSYPHALTFIILLFGTIVGQFLRNSHCAEIWTAHCTEVIVGFMTFHIILTCSRRVKRKVELILPSELEARFAQGVIPDLCTRMPFGQVGGVGSDFVCDHAVTHIFKIREREM